jgi:hypothetical protein
VLGAFPMEWSKMKFFSFTFIKIFSPKHLHWKHINIIFLFKNRSCFLLFNADLGVYKSLLYTVTNHIINGQIFCCSLMKACLVKGDFTVGFGSCNSPQSHILTTWATFLPATQGFSTLYKIFLP